MEAKPLQPDDVTLVGVFENVEAAAAARDRIRRGRLADEMVGLGRRGDGPEQGLTPVVTGPGYGLSAEDRSPPESDDQLGSGVAVGATLGATAGILASTYIIPGLGTLTDAAPLVSAVIGAGLGSFGGGLLEYSVSEPDDADRYAGTVRLGGVLLVCRTNTACADACRAALSGAGALEVRVHPGGPVGAEASREAALTNDGGRRPGPLGTGWPGAGLG